MVKSNFKYGFLGLFGGVEPTSVCALLETLDTHILHGLKGKGGYPVVFHLNSPGGCAQSASSLCVALEQLKKTNELWTVAGGEVSSAAIDVFLTGDKRFVHGDCTSTMHRSHTALAEGEKFLKHDHEAAARSLARQDELLEAQFNMLKIPDNLVEDVKHGKDVTFDTEEMYKYGLATHRGTVWEYIRRNYGSNGRKKAQNTGAKRQGRGKRKGT